MYFLAELENLRMGFCLSPHGRTCTQPERTLIVQVHRLRLACVLTCKGPMTGSPLYAGGVGGWGGRMTAASALLLR